MYIHPQAICESDQIGEGTRIWAFAHIMAGARIGAGCNIGDGAFIESGACIGDRVTVKNQVMIWDGVHIEDDVFVGPGVIFTNDRHPRSPRMPRVRHRYEKPENWRQETHIARGASIGAGAILLPGVTVGAYALIAAGALVTKNVPPHQIALGNPARIAGWVCLCGGSLNPELTCSLCGQRYQVRDHSLCPIE